MNNNVFRAIDMALNAVGDTSNGTPPITTTPSSDLSRRIRLLEVNLAKALMINEALWELIRDHHKLTEKHLFDKLCEVDLRDGTMDGKNQCPVRDCPECHRPVSGKLASCLYCGKAMDDSVFQMNM